MVDRRERVIVITKKSKATAHHGGAWKVAYADFVTAMMALFMVLWLVSQTDEQTRQKLSEYFRTGMFSGAPALVMGGSGVAEHGFLDANGGILQLEQRTLAQSAEEVKKALLVAEKADAELANLIKNMDVRVTDEGLLIQIIDGGDGLVFDLSSAELKPKLRQLLEVIAPVLGHLKNKIQVHGHTDARPFPPSSERTNWELSFMRADAARRVIEAHGVALDQIDGVFAHGASSPYVKTDPFDARNRRLAILAVRLGAEDLAARGMPTSQGFPIRKAHSPTPGEAQPKPAAL